MNGLYTDHTKTMFFPVEAGNLVKKFVIWTAQVLRRRTGSRGYAWPPPRPIRTPAWPPPPARPERPVKRIGLHRQLPGGPERVREIAAKLQGLVA